MNTAKNATKPANAKVLEILVLNLLGVGLPKRKTLLVPDPEVESTEKPFNGHLAIEIAKFDDPSFAKQPMSYRSKFGSIRSATGSCAYIFERVRKENNLRRPKCERRLPQLLTEDDLKAFFKVISNTEHEIMMRFPLMSESLSFAERAEAFRIRVLVGPMQGRDDAILEFMADRNERGEWSYNPEAAIVTMLAQGVSIRVLDDRSFLGCTEYYKRPPFSVNRGWDTAIWTKPPLG